MASKNSWEFECPQFVDFCSGVESGTIEDIWFGDNSPDSSTTSRSLAYGFMRSRAHLRNNYLSTPIEKQAYPSAFHPTNKTDSEKYRVRLVSKRLSKSDSSINTIGINPIVFKEDSLFPVLQRKKSISVADVRNKKKLVYPTTPMCLKRTRCKAKCKRKTTEELELEKIAELQKQTLQHIRSNEIAMRRLKLKQKPPVQQRQLANAEITVNTTRRGDHAAINEKSVPVRNARLHPRNENNSFASSERSRTVAPSFDINKPTSSRHFWEMCVWKKSEDGHVFEAKPESDKKTDLSILPPVMKYEGHSGLSFCTSYEKRTVFKPFNFQSRTKEFGSASSLKCLQEGKENERINKSQFSFSMSTPQLKLKSKENIHNISANVQGKSAKKSGIV